MSETLDPETLLSHAGWLKGFARGLVADEGTADDVLQETWLKALQRPPRKLQALPAWLAAVARNEARQVARSEGARTQRQRRVSRNEADVRPVDDVVAKAELHRELVRRVLELAEPTRTTLLLRYFEGLKPTEIAVRQGVPAATVRSRLKRGIDHLRADLDEDCGDDRRLWVAAILPMTGVSRPTVVGTGSALAGVLIMSGKLKLILAVCVALLAGALLWWGLSAGPDTEEDAGKTIADRGRDAVLRGNPSDEKAADVREEPETEPAPPEAPTPNVPTLVVDFVDETGRPWMSEEVQARFAAVGRVPSIMFVANAPLVASGLEGLIARRFGPVDVWQHEADLTWSGGEANGSAAGPPEGGSWRVYVGRPGAAPYLSAVCTLAPGEAFRLEVPLPRTLRTVEMHVTDAVTGQPLSGAKVTPFHEIGDDAAFLRGPSLETDAGGVVHVPVLEEAARRGKGRGATWWVHTDTHARRVMNLTLERWDAAVPYELAIYPTAAAYGRAWLGNGEPAVGCEVLWASKGYTRRTRVAEDGTFRLTGIAVRDGPRRGEGLFLLDPRTPDKIQGAKVQVEAGQESEINIGQPGSGEGAVLVGTITAAGKPLAGVFIGVGAEGQEFRYDRTSEDGTYRVEGIGRGEFEIRFAFGDPFVVDDFTAASAERTSFHAGTETRVDLDLPGGVIRLKLVHADTGEPLAGAVGLARPANPEVERSRFAGYVYRPGWGGRTGEDGTILLLGLPPGRVHKVEAGGEGFQKATLDDVLPGNETEPAEVTIQLKPTGS